MEGLPASVGLILVAEPAVRLLFQHGQITAHDADLIARSVCFYAGAIWAFSLLQIINRAYYALHDTITPLVLSIGQPRWSTSSSRSPCSGGSARRGWPSARWSASRSRRW